MQVVHFVLAAPTVTVTTSSACKVAHSIRNPRSACGARSLKIQSALLWGRFLSKFCPLCLGSASWEARIACVCWRHVILLSHAVHTKPTLVTRTAERMNDFDSIWFVSAFSIVQAPQGNAGKLSFGRA